MVKQTSNTIQDWRFVALTPLYIKVLLSLLDQKLKRHKPKQPLANELYTLMHILEQACLSSDDTSSDESQNRNQSES